ncbi:hypothetical protein QFC20_007422 [Naganishia adeliensis]|uniref:Uncharacterized protein n=1 Tax=Naganishia adeliensis TaxID=92952 RepID=A0ACC2UZX5_9TREE|nr:hypothetical protein QFC20_007422 [Naganishia adeliensis]
MDVHQQAKVEVPSGPTPLSEASNFGAFSVTSDDFVYEYIGEVIPEDIFRERIKEYADEGIQHFYFMMLQKGEYIDATKRGGIARFLNHSCEPNCYVAKWVVGRRMRMGIFAKRDIIRGEELTFNYNVDRYGSAIFPSFASVTNNWIANLNVSRYDAQVCYCGEHSCLGTIGGKTQTDIRILDPLYIEALGSYNIVEANVKCTKKRKIRTVEDINLDDLWPLEFADVQKVVTATRQAANQGHKNMIVRLLHRMKITLDVTINREIMRLKGFHTMGCIFDILDLDEAVDEGIAHSVLQVLENWQLKWRNKIKEFGIENRIETLIPRFSLQSQGLAQRLLERWRGLPLDYEIPRIDPIKNLSYRPIAEDDIASEPRWKEESRPIEFALAPVVQASYPSRPAARAVDMVNQSKTSTPNGATEKARLESILAAAAAKDTDQGESDIAKSQDLRQAARDRVRKNAGVRERTHKRLRTSAESKDRRLKRLAGELVIQSLSKYREQIDRDTFKKYAEQVG